MHKISTIIDYCRYSFIVSTWTDAWNEIVPKESIYFEKKDEFLSKYEYQLTNLFVFPNKIIEDKQTNDESLYIEVIQNLMPLLFHQQVDVVKNIVTQAIKNK